MYVCEIRSCQVSRWRAQPPAQVRLFWLPPDSPELNPDELLNQEVKSNALGRRRPVDRQELIDNLRSSLRSTPRRPEKVRRYFHERPVRSAA